jgi:hypothetical protein
MKNKFTISVIILLTVLIVLFSLILFNTNINPVKISTGNVGNNHVKLFFHSQLEQQ